MIDVAQLALRIESNLPPSARLRALVADDAAAVRAIAVRLGQAEPLARWRHRLEGQNGDAVVGLGVEARGGLVAYVVGHRGDGGFGLVD